MLRFSATSGITASRGLVQSLLKLNGNISIDCEFIQNNPVIEQTILPASSHSTPSLEINLFSSVAALLPAGPLLSLIIPGELSRRRPGSPSPLVPVQSDEAPLRAVYRAATPTRPGPLSRRERGGGGGQTRPYGPTRPQRRGATGALAVTGSFPPLRATAATCRPCPAAPHTAPPRLTAPHAHRPPLSPPSPQGAWRCPRAAPVAGWALGRGELSARRQLAGQQQADGGGSRTVVAARGGRRGEPAAPSPGGGGQLRRGTQAATKEVVKQSISSANCE